ncbi:MAG: hypothetical protein JRF06_04045 [Deltaproteobacteria bacterium]|nr:hypothetical protein [Deltaproteobacteria bacterium]
MGSNERKFLPAFAELIDRLTVDQIKEVLLPEIKITVADEMEKLCHDVDLLIEERELKLSSRIIRIIIALSQLNLHIWRLKDQMQEGTVHYNEQLKKAHQLNGIRNQLKNILLQEAKDKEKSSQRTNFNTDGLEGWNISIK